VAGAALERLVSDFWISAWSLVSIKAASSFQYLDSDGAVKSGAIVTSMPCQTEIERRHQRLERVVPSPLLSDVHLIAPGRTEVQEIDTLIGWGRVSRFGWLKRLRLT